MFNYTLKNKESNLVYIPINGISLEAVLTSPKQSKALVIFSQGNGDFNSILFYKKFAEYLNNNGYSTLLLDLLTKDEAKNNSNLYDIDLLTERLIVVTDWATHHSIVSMLPIAYLGSSTGSAAALKSAVGAGDTVKAIISICGKVDIGLDNLGQLAVPTLLIVGSIDKEILKLNKHANELIRCPKDLIIIPGDIHLHEETDKMNIVLTFTIQWLNEYH